MMFELFLSFFQVGLFSIGGGLAALPFIQYQIVELHGWLTLSEFTDIITIAEMTPGPIAINSATFVGTRLAGIPGAVIATLGCILAPCILVSLLAAVYFKYKDMSIMKSILASLRPAIVAMIASAGVSILLMALFSVSSGVVSFNIIGAVLFASSLFVLRKWKPSPILIMLGTGFIGGIIYLIR